MHPPRHPLTPRLKITAKATAIAKMEPLDAASNEGPEGSRDD